MAKRGAERMDGIKEWKWLFKHCYACPSLPNFLSRFIPESEHRFRTTHLQAILYWKKKILWKRFFSQRRRYFENRNIRIIEYLKILRKPKYSDHRSQIDWLYEKKKRFSPPLLIMICWNCICCYSRRICYYIGFSQVYLSAIINYKLKVCYFN